MSVESSFNYLTRSYEKIYQEMKYIKKIKLTEKSDKNIRLHAFGKLNDLHDKKWNYKNNISDLNEELEDIRSRLSDSSISDLERAQLRLAFQETKLERDKEVRLLPRRMKKINKKMNKIITETRNDLLQNEERRPIKISDVSVGKFRKLMARFEAIHNFFSANMGAVESKGVADIAHTSTDNLEAAKSRIDVSSIDPKEVEAAISKRLDEEEQNYENNVAQETSQVVADDMEKQVSDFIDGELENNSFESQIVESNDFENESSVNKSVVNDIEPEIVADETLPEVSIDSMFGVEEEKNQSRVDVEIPEDRVVTTPVEEEISLTSEQETMEDYASKLDSLKEEFSVAANLGDIDKLREIKSSMASVVNSINAIKEKEENNLEKAQEEEKRAKKEEEEAKIKVINGLTSDIKSLMTNGDDSINYASSLQQQTSATVARTNKLKVSIETLNSYATSEVKNLDKNNTNAELEAMFDNATNNAVNSSSKIVK